MKKLTLLFFILGIVLTSCNRFDDLSSTDINNNDAEFAIPIGTASFTIRDLVGSIGDSTLVLVGPDSTIRLNYRGDLTFEDAEGAFFGAINAALDAFPIAPIQDTVSTLPWIAPAGIDLDSIRLKSGILTFINFENPLDEEVTVNWRFENAVSQDTGDTLAGTFIIPPSADNFTDTIELNRQVLLPLNGEFKFQYNAQIDSDPNYIVPGLFVAIDSLEFSYAEGVFDNIRYEGAPDIIELELFDQWVQGDIFFENPEIKIFSENSFGIPTRADILFFDVRTVQFGDLPLESPIIDSIDFTFPTLPDEIGVIARDTFIFNAENSNIEDILFGGPQAILYHVDAITNPGSVNPIRGFITDESFYKFVVEADLPLFGKSIGFEVNDTIAFDFSSFDRVSHAEIKIVTDNELGLEVETQGYFLNTAGEIIDSLFANSGAESILTAADTDADGFVTGVSTTEIFAPFSAERFTNIRQADRIAITAKFFSPNKGEQSVRVEVDQEVEIRMGMTFGLNDD